jgi:two-component system, OmpR family, KDP operon response regulator KdpE
VADVTARVLIVDDEPQIRRFLRTSLAAHGYTILEAVNGQEALLRATDERPDVVILDLGLPDLDGMEIIRRVREWSKVPIIVLSVRGRESDKIAALDAGADDYVTKPFSMGELMARIRAALRNRMASETDEPVFRTGGLEIDLAKRQVRVDGRDVKLTPNEYELLRVLVTNAGKVVTHQYLLREVWGPADLDQTHYVRVYVGQIRQKIETDSSQPRYILTEPGVGYRLVVSDES